MNLDDIAHSRLHNLQLSRPELGTPAEMVGWLGAAQAQDFAGAKWSLGLRLRPTHDAAIEQAFNDGQILRTHMMRPTWHFVTPADIRWILALTSPRVHQLNRSMYRQLELDGDTLARCATVITDALGGGRQLTRNEAGQALEGAGIRVPGGPDRGGQRLAYIMMWAELEGLICSGPRRGKQFTYMLLDERAPNATTLSRDEALAELTRRYFRSHGPAMAADFARWSGLTLTDARAGLAAVAAELQQAVIEGQAYWFAGDPRPPRDPSPTAYLVSIYDEYTIGYKDGRAIGSAAVGEILAGMGNALQNVIILDGQIVGTWRRAIKSGSVMIALHPLQRLTERENAAVVRAAGLYGEFVGLPVEFTYEA
ncbi:conserved protein of unknown function [Candidatus Promineifilum breve]|uniref:Winged helix DNA-binding domain-containing protein n=1 Tax=Candidatus Promineifilum breve TaxID=1806508 RepID=A0A160T1I4_9CHLR|nr:winged helix DNA-binding domain-containing protein [Candidatus Promineifilum breve]CUS03891.2 conserved protein of unknown function [Candidatus Promineifilum breve]